MKSKVVVDIDVPQKKVATLCADPTNNIKWMSDVERYEPVSGKQGMPGSIYRLVPKGDSGPFVATMVQRLPNEIRLTLDSPEVTIDVRRTLSTLNDGRTRFTSNEVLSFKGVWNKAVGLISTPAIRRAHRKHVEAFKKFVEREEGVTMRSQTPTLKRPSGKKAKGTRGRTSKLRS